MQTIDPKHMFPQVSPLAGNRPKVGRTVLPADKPATMNEWAKQLFRPEPKKIQTSRELSFEL